MKTKREEQRTGADRSSSRHFAARTGAAGVLLALLACGTAVADDDDGISAWQLRRFIDRQVGGIETLQVPTNNADLPQPRLANGNPDPFFETTEAKRYLGKQLFHDPVRATRILPEFGGVPATSGTSSCGSCHLGEAASKSGTLLNFAAGGEGRGYTDAEGNFIPRRRPRTDILPRLRQSPLFPGDALVDQLPTLTDIYETGPSTPARGRRPLPGDKTDTRPPAGMLLATGRLDALDSVARNPLSIIGAAFNNRLLFGGFAGEPDATHGALNPFGHPAQENVALLLLDAHRMLDDHPGVGPERFQSAALEQIAVYRKLFREAFPDEASQAPGCVPGSAPGPSSCNRLINDITVFRATASYMRTVVTRNTPWDRFLAGDNRALTARQREGARLFFTPATASGNYRGDDDDDDDDDDDGRRARGAGCYACHSGPMLNKQVNDPDVAGVGEFVEKNFFNLGLADHPLQALNRAGRNDPSHRDDGRREVTFRDSDAFKFRTLTLRQLKDARFFFHNGSLTSVKDVVRYFNVGVPQDAQAAAASTFTTRRFSFPRGPGSRRGLGLSKSQVDALTDFVENALYDPAFVHFDPDSTTDTFQLNERDTTYSIYRPDLAELGAVDGRPGSGLPQDNNDALSRRDQGLEFLDVTGRVQITLIDSDRLGSRGRGRQQRDTYRITNTSSSVVDTHLLMIAFGLPDRISLQNGSGITSTNDPYRRVFLRDGVLLPGQSIVEKLSFRRSSGSPPVSYVLRLLSGQGNP